MEDTLRVRPKRNEYSPCFLLRCAINHMADHLLVATMNAIKKTDRENCWFRWQDIGQL